jgi:hypothetical protein
MSRTDRRLILQRAYAAKQLRLFAASQLLDTREWEFLLFQQERAEVGTAAVVSAIHSGATLFCYAECTPRAFSEALRTRLRTQSYEPAVTGALRDTLELDNLRNMIETLSATSTARYADFM